MNRARILITGATGFLGRQVLKNLPVSSTKLRLILREPMVSVALELRPDAELVVTNNLFNESVDWWARQCEGIHIVLHLAWFVEHGEYLSSLTNIECLKGSLNIAAGALSSHVSRFIGIGTCFEYEYSYTSLTIKSPIVPLTLYAATKASLYLTLTNLLPSKGIEFAWCRLFYLYGEHEDPRRLVPYLRRQFEQGQDAQLTEGNQIRDYMNVSEAGRYIATITLGTQIGPINVCSGIPISIRQLAEELADQYGRRDLLKFGARPHNYFDPSYVVGLPNMDPCV